MTFCGHLLLTAESLQVTESYPGTFPAFARSCIQQQTRLVAALGYAISAGVEIRQSQRGLKVALPHGLP
jgi:hypothetical protein